MRVLVVVVVFQVQVLQPLSQDQDLQHLAQEAIQVEQVVLKQQVVLGAAHLQQIFSEVVFLEAIMQVVEVVDTMGVEVDG
jgi:hypothetical protein